LGATSTLAFLLAGREPDPGERRHRLAMIQFANMGGQVLAPLVGAAAAARLGFRVSFLLAGLTLAGCAALLQWGNLRILPPSESVSAARHRSPPLQIVVLAAAVVLVGSAQESFLTSVLPSVLPGLGVTPAGMLEVGGMLIFVSGVAGAAGTLLAPRLADQVHYRRLVPALLAASSAGLVLLGGAG